MFPHTITPLETKLNHQLMKDFTGARGGFVRVGQQGWLLPAQYADQAQGCYSMSLRPDDIWVATFPRSGTTLCQELVWLINNDFDYEAVKKIPLNVRFPFLEFGMLHHPELHKQLLEMNNYHPEVKKLLTGWMTPKYEQAPHMDSPRHFKTHLPFSLLPPSLTDSCKVIYVARNPLDVAVSYFHHNRLLTVHGYIGDFEKYWHYFQEDQLLYSPYWEHLKEAWEKRNHPNMLFLFYEDLIKDLPKSIRAVSEFLGKSISEEQVVKLTNHLQIDNFRKNTLFFHNIPLIGFTNDQEQGFIRQGKVMGNKEFSEELKAEANKWMTENLALTDLRFPLE